MDQREVMKQQRGGTFLGFVIGVVVGLGSALGVAVYVTKVPIPFVYKGQSRSADQDVAESKKNKDWDPNTPLYGKNPVKPALPALADSAAAASAPVLGAPPAPAAMPAVPAATTAATVSTNPAAPVTPPPPPAVAAKPAVSADPLGDLAKARSANGASELFSFFIQVGAFRTPEDAEAQRAKLALLGLDPKVTEREQSGRAVFRVRIGPFDKKEDAEKPKVKLEAAGYETVLVRVQR
jgi:cell division protein FtsN